MKKKIINNLQAKNFFSFLLITYCAKNNIDTEIV